MSVNRAHVDPWIKNAVSAFDVPPNAVVAIAIYIRRQPHETPIFEEIKAKGR